MEKPTIERLRLVAGQLINVGSKESIGFGPNRVGSIPGGIAKTLVAYLDYRAQQVEIVQENALFASEFITPYPCRNIPIQRQLLYETLRAQTRAVFILKGEICNRSTWFEEAIML
jgi:hypothetical protein